MRPGRDNPGRDAGHAARLDRAQQRPAPQRTSRHPPGQHSAAPYGAGTYAPSWTERTYQELLHRAGKLLSLGESVIADATWISAEHRAAAAAMADSAAADMIQLQCAAPPAVAARRMSSRTDSVSDADPGVATRMAAAQAPWPDAITLDASGSEAPRPCRLAS
jgi:uncharacterized protein